MQSTAVVWYGGRGENSLWWEIAKL